MASVSTVAGAVIWMLAVRTKRLALFAQKCWHILVGKLDRSGTAWEGSRPGLFGSGGCYCRRGNWSLAWFCPTFGSGPRTPFARTMRYQTGCGTLSARHDL